MSYPARAEGLVNMISHLITAWSFFKFIFSYTYQRKVNDPLLTIHHCPLLSSRRLNSCFVTFETISVKICEQIFHEKSLTLCFQTPSDFKIYNLGSFLFKRSSNLTSPSAIYTQISTTGDRTSDHRLQCRNWTTEPHVYIAHK